MKRVKYSNNVDIVYKTLDRDFLAVAIIDKYGIDYYLGLPSDSIDFSTMKLLPICGRMFLDFTGLSFVDFNGVR